MLRDLPREPVEVGDRERRISMADQDEIALPGTTHACPRPDDLGVKAKVRPEDSECCEGDGELLRGGRQE